MPRTKLFRSQYPNSIQTSVYIKGHLVLPSTISYWWKFFFWSAQISYSSPKITLRAAIQTGGNSCIECAMWHFQRKEKWSDFLLKKIKSLLALTGQGETCWSFWRTKNFGQSRILFSFMQLFYTAAAVFTPVKLLCELGEKGWRFK